MKKQIKLIGFMIIAMLVITGCRAADIGDSYVEGSDYQYMFQGTAIFYQQNARGSNGYFFLRGHYIYYLDDNTQQLVPLCNKVDCLHNEETDEERYEECNANVTSIVSNLTSFGMTGISYCNGYLYYIQTDFVEDSQNLYRMKEDGSEKQSIYQWNGRIVEEWCIHRDVLYFVEHTYETGEDEQEETQPIEKYAVKQLELTGIGRKSPQTIYEAEQGLTVYSLSKVKAYGNHVYFTIHAATLLDTSSITDENYLDYTYFKQITYDTITGECKALALPEEKNGVYISSITFWNGKLILKEYDYNQELDGIANSYISDLDGSNAEIFEKDKIQGEIYISDGKYLYISNSPLVERGYEEKQYYRVYDEDMNLIDTMEVPFIGDSEIGMEEGQYAFTQNEDGTGLDLMFFDKSTLGTYNGSSTRDSYRKIAEMYYSPEDLSEIQGIEESE